MTFKQEAHNRFYILEGMVKNFPQIDIDSDYKRLSESDAKTNWLFSEKNINTLINKINQYCPKLKEYAVKRAFSINMSEMIEYIIADTLKCVKCNKFDKIGDVIINGVKYDIKCVSNKWCGSLYRNYNSNYINVTYSSKLDFINKEKIKNFINFINPPMYDGTDITLFI